MQTAVPRHQWLVLAGFVLLCLAVGSIGGFATQHSIDTWYATLNKPSWNPPNWVFAPVWTLLYIMMGTAAWLVWKTRDRIGPAMVLFFAQLAFNLLWSLVFFGLRSPGLALWPSSRWSSWWARWRSPCWLSSGGRRRRAGSSCPISPG